MNEQILRKDIINALLLSFNIPFYDLHEVQGATLTLYKFRPKIGTRIAKIRNLKDDIAAALGVQSVRIIAPMDDGSVGIEVPNRQREILSMSDILNSWEFQNTPAILPCAIGRTVTNEVFIADLAEMPHLLVAGATGQGKSVGLNMIIMSLIHKKSPEEMKIMLVDPKQVEFGIYSKIQDSYLACPVITEPDEAARKLASVCTLMDERYSIVSSAGVRNIQEYNTLPTVEHLPYLVVVIDEYGDLVMTSGRELERTICRIAQKARAVGIHLILSTQRPDTKVVTGNIKANFPTRIAFRTTTGIDSRVILDQLGAEKLSGRGDMLYFSGSDTVRVQCAYASVSDVSTACESIRTEYADMHSSFRLPLSIEEIAQQQMEEALRKREEEEKMWERRTKEAEERMNEWLKDREKNKDRIEARRKQLFRHFYGSNTNYMTLCIPGDSVLKNKH